MAKEEASLLQYVEQMMTSIDDLDPSLADGFRLVYDRECPLEIRVQESSQQVGTLEAVRVKVLVQGEEDAPAAVRVELSSDTDLFFHFSHTVDDRSFQEIQEKQQLMVDFPDYPNVISRMLNDCIKEPHSHLAVFTLQSTPTKSGRLEFIQNMEYKFVELLSCSFDASSEAVIQQHISFRYNAMKSRLALMQSRLQEVNNLIKVKNPSLLLQLQKTAPPVVRKTA